MRCKGHVTRKIETRNACKTLVRKLKGRNYSKDLKIDGRVIKCVLEQRVGECGSNYCGSGQGPVAVSFEHSNETSYSIKEWEFDDQLIGF